RPARRDDGGRAGRGPGSARSVTTTCSRGSPFRPALLGAAGREGPGERLAEVRERLGDQPGDVHLAHADGAGDLLLGEFLEEPQVQDVPLPGGETAQGGGEDREEFEAVPGGGVIRRRG